MRKIVIDGRQLCGEIGGVQRFLRETILELDKIADAGQFEVLVPKNATVSIKLENIKIVKWGGHEWTALGTIMFANLCYFKKIYRTLSMYHCSTFTC